MKEEIIGGAARTAMDKLLGRIRNGTLEEGTQLPPERVLASELGVARNTLRRALDHLERDGYLVRRIGAGTFVRVTGKGNDTGLRGRLRFASPAELMEVRLIIEPQAAAMAATRASSPDIEAIEEALAKSLSAHGLAEFEHWDAQLHLMIFRGTKNSVLVDYCEAVNAIRNEPHWYRLKKRSVSSEVRSVYDRQHTDLVTAIKERDPERARLVATRHLSNVRDNLLGTL